MTPEQRAAVVSEALTWQGTPYHHQGNIKNAGVDCIMILVEVYKTCCLIPADTDPRPYTQDWYLHNHEEVYLNGVEQFATPVESPLPGDIVLFRFGHCVGHGGLVIEWPLIIHAYRPDGMVILADITKSAALTKRLHGFYSLKG